MQKMWTPLFTSSLCWLAGKSFSRTAEYLTYLRIAESGLTHKTTRIEVKRGVQVLALVATLAFGVDSVMAQPNFNRIATFPVYQNLAPTDAKTSRTAAEILTAAQDDTLIIYSNSPMRRLGFVDISDPAQPAPDGFLQLDGEPTSVSVIGDFAYVGINSSTSFTEPSGYLGVVDLKTRRLIQRCDLFGQPDSVAVSPDGRFIAVAVENERDEDKNGGVIPQLPAGHLASFRVDQPGQVTNCAKARHTSLLGLAQIAGADPEPEYVAINDNNIAAVTLQENNHIVLVDLEQNTVVAHFSAGQQDVDGIDLRKDKIIALTETGKNLLREPDAVAWLDNTHLITANEGDYQGGSRGFTVFDTSGAVTYDSGNHTESLAVAHGHYPEKRSAKKGTEPEGVAVGTYDTGRYVFVGLERANAVLVYKDSAEGLSFQQFLPTGVAPEGILPLPQRKLLVVANEYDNAKDKVRSTLSLYALDNKPAAYPSLVAASDAQDIGWGALSGLSADRNDPNTLYAVNDSFYAQASIYQIDTTTTPAKITGQTLVHADGQAIKNLDLEGIAQDSDGTFWLASEGHPQKGRDNHLLHVQADGAVIETVALPDWLSEGWKRHGLEGIALDGARIVTAIQREWDSDPKGLVRIVIYNKKSGDFSVVHYPLDAVASPAGGWVGLSEITATGTAGVFWVIERDNQKGTDARIKRIYSIDLNSVTASQDRVDIPVLSKKLVHDLLPLMKAGQGRVLDKIEGLSIQRDGTAFAVTDNDGVDGASGETLFLHLGKL